MNVTAVLLNYRRPENLVQLIDSLKQQVEQCKLIIVDNAGPGNFSVGRPVGIPWNAGPYARVLFAAYAKTEWIMFWDDDLMPGDAEFVRDMLALARQHPDGMTGAYGRGLLSHPPYYSARTVFGAVPIVLHKACIFRRDLLKQVRLWPAADLGYIGNDDIFLPLEIGRCEPVHWADRGLRKRVVQLPVGKEGLEYRPEHYKRRGELCGRYVRGEMQ